MSRSPWTFVCLMVALTHADNLSSRALALDFDFALIVTTDTQIPGAPAGTTFSNIPQPALRGGNVLFRGEGPGTEGIYGFRGGQLEMLVDKNTVVPGDPNAGNFADFINTPALDTDFNVAFMAQADNGGKGIYTVVDGVVTMIADTNTRVPNTSPSIDFTNFSNPWIADGNVVFRGTGPGLDGI